MWFKRKGGNKFPRMVTVNIWLGRRKGSSHQSNAYYICQAFGIYYSVESSDK